MLISRLKSKNCSILTYIAISIPLIPASCSFRVIPPNGGARPGREPRGSSQGCPRLGAIPGREPRGSYHICPRLGANVV